MSPFVLSQNVDAQGPDTLWNRTYGDTAIDVGYFVKQTLDGGFVIAGKTYSHSPTSDFPDWYLIRTDANGDKLWTKVHGGPLGDTAMSVELSGDGGFIFVGDSRSFGPGVIAVYMVKTDDNGQLLWTKAYGGSGRDRGYDVKKTPDGGYIIVGWSNSFAFFSDVFLVKTDSAGNQIWTQTFGGSSLDYGYAVDVTRDSGYILAGHSFSFGPPSGNVYLIRTDSLGDELWSKAIGGANDDAGKAVQQTPDGGFTVAGKTESFGVGTPNFPNVYLIRIAPEPAPVFTVSPDSLFFSTVAMSDTVVDSMMVTNAGSVDLIINSILSTNPLFSVTPTSEIIAPDSTAPFFIQFTADTLAGMQHGVLVFHYNGLTSPDSVFVQADVTTEIAGQDAKIPEKFVLHQNYPNPFNPVTHIRFGLAKTTNVKIAIFNILGQKVSTLLDAKKPAGQHVIKFDGSKFASGVYLYRIQAGEFLDVKKPNSYEFGFFYDQPVENFCCTFP